MRTFAHVARTVALDGALVLALVALWRLTASDRAAALARGATLADLLVAGAGLVVVTALGWLALLSALLLLEPLAGRRLTGWAGCPDGLRRVLLVVCGVATATALALPANAATHRPDPSPGARPTTDDRGTSALLDGLPMPDRPMGAAPRRVVERSTGDAGSARTAPSAPTTDTAQRRAARASGAEDSSHAPVRPSSPDPVDDYTVRAGDTLWGVAAERLGPGADASATARAWRLIYAVNRDVVGTDPDLIQPGTTLRVPPTVQEDRP